MEWGSHEIVSIVERHGITVALSYVRLRPAVNRLTRSQSCQLSHFPGFRNMIRDVEYHLQSKSKNSQWRQANNVSLASVSIMGSKAGVSDLSNCTESALVNL